MKSIVIIILFNLYATSLSAQKQTYDLVSYTPPAGWKIEEKDNMTSYTITNSKNNSWCQIFIVKSTISKGSIEKDFESEWQELVVKNYHPADQPQLDKVQEANGWKIQAGAGKFIFNKADAVVMLTTISGHARCASIVSITNSQDYIPQIESFLYSVELKQIEQGGEPNEAIKSSAHSVIPGSWGKSNAVSQVNNRFGDYSYNKQQYTFNPDGSYSFASKTYDEKHSETFLIKETGSFVISDNTITIKPKTSVIEAWSKKNGGDNWNQLKSSKKRPLETETYQFTIVDNNLVLQTAKETQRDGAFNDGNAYRYGPSGSFTPIILPDGDQLSPAEVQKETEKQQPISINPEGDLGFAFNTTNFDDGWTSKVQEDWVEVTKGSMKVLLHYPREGTIFPADPEPLTNAAWNILVAPRYNNLRNYKTAYITSYDRPYLGMGYATEKASGKDVFIVLFRQGQTGWLEFIAQDKNSFIQEYKFDPETIRWDSETNLMIPLAGMAGYNKFAVAASDLKGKWTSDFTGIQQLYNIYTGQYAGMNMNQSNEEFIFNSGNSYSWKLLVVSGMVGNAKYTEVKSSGEFSVPNNWQVHFSKIETGPRTFHAFWSCIKGARVLNLLDANVPGSGIYTRYGLAK